MNLDNLGGRKFVLAILSLVAGLLTHSLSPKGLSTEVVAMIVGILGTFSVANTVATVKAPNSQEPTDVPEQVPSPATSAPVEPVADNGQTALLEQIAITVSNTQQLLVNAMQANNQQK